MLSGLQFNTTKTPDFFSFSFFWGGGGGGGVGGEVGGGGDETAMTSTS